MREYNNLKEIQEDMKVLRKKIAEFNTQTTEDEDKLEEYIKELEQLQSLHKEKRQQLSSVSFEAIRREQDVRVNIIEVSCEYLNNDMYIYAHDLDLIPAVKVIADVMIEDKIIRMEYETHTYRRPDIEEQKIKNLFKYI